MAAERLPEKIGGCGFVSVSAEENDVVVSWYQRSRYDQKHCYDPEFHLHPPPGKNDDFDTIDQNRALIQCYVCAIVDSPLVPCWLDADLQVGIRKNRH
jgi:hypothetical protein